MRKVILTKKAGKKLDKLLDYLETEWSPKVKNDFISKMDRAVSHLKKYPHSNEESGLRKGLYKCVVTKQTTLFYRYDESSVNIVNIFDNRMNPNRLKREL